jgi:hypothetical protein
MTDPAKTEVKLPEMPRTYVVHWADSQQELHYHTAEQLTEFATAAVLQEREARAAKWERAHGFDKYGVANFIRTGALRAQKREA